MKQYELVIRVRRNAVYLDLVLEAIRGILYTNQTGPLDVRILLLASWNPNRPGISLAKRDLHCIGICLGVGLDIHRVLAVGRDEPLDRAHTRQDLRRRRSVRMRSVQ